MKKILIISVLLFSSVLFAQESFNSLSFVSFSSNLTYTIGEDVQSYSAEKKLEPFSINKYETTYSLWYQVRVKAEKKGYFFENKGKPGNNGKTSSKPTEQTMYQPVVNISWHDAIVWCNAFSELKGLKPCYSYKGNVIRDSSSAECDLAECDWASNGYRLPSEAEWEYAARRINGGFQKGNLVSGQLSEDVSSDDYCWDCINSTETHEVGSKLSNGSGLFDMSGNVLEYCWDWFGEYTETASAYGKKTGDQRVSRGGSFSEFTMFTFCGDRYSFDPNEAYDYSGFRLAKTK